MNPDRNKVLTDGGLYFLMALLAGLLEFLSSDDAHQHINPHVLFWGKGISSSLIAGFNALKAFRSMTYGRAYGQLSPTPVTVPPTTTPQTPTIDPKS